MTEAFFLFKWSAQKIFLKLSLPKRIYKKTREKAPNWQHAPISDIFELNLMIVQRKNAAAAVFPDPILFLSQSALDRYSKPTSVNQWFSF